MPERQEEARDGRVAVRGPKILNGEEDAAADKYGRPADKAAQSAGGIAAARIA
jgi:hypothetical protein